MSTIPEPPPIGERLRQLRSDRDMSLDDLAQLSGVSKSMLSQIEQNKANPTVALVWKIARALDVELMHVIGGETRDVRFDLTAHDHAPVLEEEDRGCTIKILSPIELVETLELYWITMKAGATLDSSAHVANSEEFATVLRGKVEIEVEGHRATLEPGDTLRYHVDRDHHIRNLSRGTSEVYLVVHYE